MGSALKKKKEDISSNDSAYLERDDIGTFAEEKFVDRGLFYNETRIVQYEDWSPEEPEDVLVKTGQERLQEWFDEIDSDPNLCEGEKIGFKEVVKDSNYKNIYSGKRTVSVFTEKGGRLFLISAYFDWRVLFNSKKTLASKAVLELSQKDRREIAVEFFEKDHDPAGILEELKSRSRYFVNSSKSELAQLNQFYGEWLLGKEGIKHRKI